MTKDDEHNEEVREKRKKVQDAVFKRRNKNHGDKVDKQKKINFFRENERKRGKHRKPFF